MSRAPALTFQPDDRDRQIGARLREQRHARGLSQTALGERLGLSFQQIQKYERGANRIAASTIIQIATVLDVPVTWLLGVSALDNRTADKSLESEDAHDVLAAFDDIRSARIRTLVLRLMKEVGNARCVTCEHAKPSLPHNAASRGSRS